MNDVVHYIVQSNPCEAAECVGCGAWDPEDPNNTCPAWAKLKESEA